jgi:hypothetical protein
MISGNFESRFKQYDEAEVNADEQKRRCNKSLITDRPEKRALAQSGQQALTVALESAVTMRRGDPALLSGAALADAPAACAGTPTCSAGSPAAIASHVHWSGIVLWPAAASISRRCRFGLRPS